MNIPKGEKHSAYSHRDVMSLKPLHELDEVELESHLKHNRVLQYNFATRSGDDLLRDGREAGESWITDFVCPSVEAALMMHLSKEMVVRYKVLEDEIGEYANKAYIKLGRAEDGLIKKLKHTIDESLASIESDPEYEDRINNLARERIEKNKRYLQMQGKDLDTQDPAKIEAAKRIVRDLERKRLTYEVAQKYIDSHRAELEKSMGLETKESLPKGHNRDFVFQGAAGSGKSTIARQLLEEEKKKNYITLATDNYRAVTIPGTKHHEEPLETKNVFLRTQDMAYMIKEMVHESVQSEVHNGRRPNIIIDCITMDEFMHSLLEESKEVKSVVAAYSGDSGIGIAERAERRALTSKSPADQGRFVNTDALFYGHASASRRLLSGATRASVTEIYSTDIDYGDQPPKIAEIDPKESIVRIFDLRLAGRFFNKKNMNTKAQSPIELALGKDGDALSFHKKAESILDLVKNDHGGQVFELELFQNADSNSVKYASIRRNKEGKLEIHLDDAEVFKKIALDSASIQGSLVRSITRQIAYGSAKEAQSVMHGMKEEKLEADIFSFKKAYNHIKESKAAPIIDTSKGIDKRLKVKARSIMSKSLKGKGAGEKRNKPGSRSLSLQKADRVL